MKNQKFGYILASITVLILTGCTPKEITLEGKVSNLSGNTIVYCPTIDGVYDAHSDTLRLQPDSTYRITIPAKGNEKISFYVYGKNKLGTIYVAPGKNILHIDASQENNLQVENNLAKENEIIKLLSRLDHDVWSLRARQGDVFLVAKDTVASSIYRKLTDYASAIEQKVTGMDETFRKKAIQDVRMQMMQVFLNQYMSIYYGGSEQSKGEWETIYAQMLAYIDINQSGNVFSPVFHDVVSSIAGKELFMKTKQKPKDKNDGYRQLFDWYKKNLQGRVQEIAMSQLILEDTRQESYSTDMPALYNQFKELYPSGTLIPVLEEAIRKNISFNNQELPADIHILNTDSVRSFKEITDRYAGKVVFVDIWATWCSPCRKSFAHVEPLQKYAKENDIVLLYVSIDRPTNTALWKKMAGYYNLKGDHVIINEFFQMDIYNTFGTNGALYIPHCAIINKKGELQFKKAASPEEMDKLAEQLQEAGKTVAGSR